VVAGQVLCGVGVAHCCGGNRGPTGRPAVCLPRLFACCIYLSLLATMAPAAAWGSCMRVAHWLECPSPHRRREDRWARLCTSCSIVPLLLSSVTPQYPPSLLTVPYACVVAHSSFPVCGHPGPVIISLIYTGVIQQQQQQQQQLVHGNCRLFLLVSGKTESAHKRNLGFLPNLSPMMVLDPSYVRAGGCSAQPKQRFGSALD